MLIDLLPFCQLFTIRIIKVQYFNNKFAMISKVDHGKFVNWVIIMYSQLVKELSRWNKS